MLKLFFYKLFKPKLIATAHHEAGHCVVAALFNDKLFLKYLTIDANYLKTINPTYKGGLNIEFHTIPKNTEIEPADNLILIAYAGLCAKTLFIKGKQYVNDNLHLFSKDPNLMEIEGAVDDYELVKRHSSRVAFVLQTKKTIVEWSAVRWVFEFLMSEFVWEATEKIAKKLLNSKSLVGTEITDFLSEINFADYIDQNKTTFLSKRYPLSKTKMII